MKIFLKKIWAFDPEYWPVIAFSREGGRDKLIDESSDGDLIAFLATGTEGTAPQDRGRFLGLAEFERNKVETLNFVSESLMSKNEQTGDDKWPYAVRIRRAWEFLRDPFDVRLLSDNVLKEKIDPIAGVTWCPLLNDKSTKEILNLPRKSVPVGPGSQ